MTLEAVDSLTGLLPLLAVLALVDSLSLGTLAVPVWLLMTPGRLRAGRVLTYLLTIGAFYFAVGVLALSGAELVLPNVDWGSQSVRRVIFAFGAAMLLLSFILEPPGGRSRRSTPGDGARTSRLARWRAIAVGGDDADSVGRPSRGVGAGMALVALALTAGALELGTMLPYLAAIGLMSSADASWPAMLGLLLAYCAVMLLPAVGLLVGRSIAKDALDGVLRRLDLWFTRHGGSTLAWIVGIVGVVLMVQTGSAVIGNE